jgi:hypothetical protein
MPSSSNLIGSAVNELTASTMNMTSGYFFFSAAISASGLIVPVEVSLWMSVSASNSPVASFLSMASARMGEPHVRLQAFGLLAAALGDVEPFVRERAAHAVEDLLGHEIADRAFHHAPRAGGGQVDELFGVKQLLELRLDLGDEVFVALTAMTDHRGAKSLVSLFADFNRSWNVEFNVSHRTGMVSKLATAIKRRLANRMVQLGELELAGQAQALFQ